jgi:hypothetical protein
MQDTHADPPRCRQSAKLERRRLQQREPYQYILYCIRDMSKAQWDDDSMDEGRWRGGNDCGSAMAGAQA